MVFAWTPITAGFTTSTISAKLAGPLGVGDLAVGATAGASQLRQSDCAWVAAIQTAVAPTMAPAKTETRHAVLILRIVITEIPSPHFLRTLKSVFLGTPKSVGTG